MICAHQSILIGYRITAELQFSILLITTNKLYIFIKSKILNIRLLEANLPLNGKIYLWGKNKANMSLQGSVLSTHGDVLAEPRTYVLVFTKL